MVQAAFCRLGGLDASFETRLRRPQTTPKRAYICVIANRSCVIANRSDYSPAASSGFPKRPARS
jgi:hypothetical protein